MNDVFIKGGVYYITANGETHTSREWGKKLGIKSEVIRARVRCGLSAEECVRPIVTIERSKDSPFTTRYADRLYDILLPHTGGDFTIASSELFVRMDVNSSGIAPIIAQSIVDINRNSQIDVKYEYIQATKCYRFHISNKCTQTEPDIECKVDNGNNLEEAINPSALQTVKKHSLIFTVPESIADELAEIADANGFSIQDMVDNILTSAVSVIYFKNKYRARMAALRKRSAPTMELMAAPAATSAVVPAPIDILDFDSMPNDMPFDAFMRLISG